MIVSMAHIQIYICILNLSLSVYIYISAWIVDLLPFSFFIQVAFVSMIYGVDRDTPAVLVLDGPRSSDPLTVFTEGAKVYDKSVYLTS